MPGCADTVHHDLIQHDIQFCAWSALQLQELSLTHSSTSSALSYTLGTVLAEANFLIIPVFPYACLQGCVASIEPWKVSR